MKNSKISSAFRLLKSFILGAGFMLGIMTNAARAQTEKDTIIPALSPDTVTTDLNESADPNCKISAFLNPYEAYLQINKHTENGISPQGARFGVMSISLGSSSAYNVEFPFLYNQDNKPYPAPFTIVGAQAQIGTQQAYISPVIGMKANAVGFDTHGDSLSKIWGFVGGVIFGDPSTLEVSLESGALNQGSKINNDQVQYFGAGLEATKKINKNGLRLSFGASALTERDPRILSVGWHRTIARYFIEVESPAFIRKPAEISGVFNFYARTATNKTNALENSSSIFGMTFGGLVNLNKPLRINDSRANSQWQISKLGISFTLEQGKKFRPNIEIRRDIGAKK